MDENHFAIIEKATNTARSNLRACYLNGKIIASPLRFSDYWARDSFYALLGVLEAGDFDIARNSLKLFLDNQKSDGKIARKFALDFNGLKYLFKKSVPRKKPRPIYASLIPPFNSMDSNSLCLIAFSHYLEKTQDLDFAEKHYVKLQMAIEWYEKKKKNGLVSEYFLSNWMDTVFKSGAVLYSNVLYAESLRCFSKVAQKIGKIEDFKKYEDLHKKTVVLINEKFWNGEFFDDIAGQKRYFDSAGNTLSCLFEIASKEKAEKILGHFAKIQKGKLLPTVSPKYPFWKVNPLTMLFGMSEYHNDKSWIWIDLLVAASEFKLGQKDKALKRLGDISEIIIRNGAVHETYHNDGKPYEPRFWKSAVPFAWNSGIFLYVKEIIIKD